jgi:2-methylcitrate dehydratase PrpD
MSGWKDPHPSVQMSPTAQVLPAALAVTPAALAVTPKRPLILSGPI